METGLLIALPVASGLLATLAFPSFDLGFLAWFGLAPLLFSLRGRSPLAAAGLGFLFGCVFASGVFYWLGGISGVTPLRVAILYTAFAAYFLVFGLLYSSVSKAVGSWIILWAPALWAALEYVRANLSFLAFPWNLLGHSQYRFLPAIQIADITGVYGTSFVIVMVNQFLSQVPGLLGMRASAASLSGAPATRPNWAAHLGTIAVVLGLTLTYGHHRLAASESGERVRVALVQANVRVRSNMSLADQVEHLRAYAGLTTEAAKSQPELIVWPSSSLPAPISSWLVRSVISRLARETRAYLLVGGAGGDKFGPQKEGYSPYSNSEFLISPSGRQEAQYSKIRLTPFDEYVPLAGTVTWPRWITTLQESFVAGTEYTLFSLPRARFATPICWENIFPDLFRRFVLGGAQFMVSVTNEGFFGPTSAPYQTLAMNVFRAVENRVAVVRVATTGVSGFIDSKGQVVARVQSSDGKDTFVPGTLVWDVPLSRTRTFYTAYGDVFAQGVTGTAALIILAAVLKRWTPGGPSGRSRTNSGAPREARARLRLTRS